LGPESVLIFSGGGYFISNIAKNAGPGRAESRSGAVAADNVELDHFTISVPQGPVPTGAPFHRAIVLGGWLREDSLSPTGSGYTVLNANIHDLSIYALSGVVLAYAANAEIRNNKITGVRDFSDRCAWKSRQRTVGSEAGIVLSRGVVKSAVIDNDVTNFGAEGITVDISTSDGSMQPYAATGNTMVGNTVEHVGRAGLDVYGGNDNTIERNSVSDANMFHLRSGNATYIRGGSGNRIVNNAISGYGVLVAVVGATDDFVMPSTGNVVSGNRLTYEGRGNGMTDGRAHDCGIAESVPDYGAILSAAPGTTISDNVVVNQSNVTDVPAIYVRSSVGHTISGNTFRGFTSPSPSKPIALFAVPGNATNPSEVKIGSNRCETESGNDDCEGGGTD
jgi:parallel beta-helix repeat protein